MASGHSIWRWPLTAPGVVLATAVVATLEGSARAASGSGLGTPWVAETDVPAVLQTQTVALVADGGRPLPAQLQFEIGFSTPEVTAVGLLYDSLTLSLSRPDGSGSTILATADAFGLTLGPGGVSGLIPGGSVQVSEVDFRAVPMPGATTTFAYAVVVELPLGARSADYRATFDLFGNGDLLVSRSYALAVPEPSVMALLAAGLGWTLIRRNRA